MCSDCVNIDDENFTTDMKEKESSITETQDERQHSPSNKCHQNEKKNMDKTKVIKGTEKPKKQKDESK